MAPFRCGGELCVALNGGVLPAAAGRRRTAAHAAKFTPYDVTRLFIW